MMHLPLRDHSHHSCCLKRMYGMPAGGRREAATYDEGDAEDAAIAASARLQAARLAGESESEADEGPEGHLTQERRAHRHEARGTAHAPESSSSSSDEEESTEEEEDEEDLGGVKARRQGGAGEALECYMVLPVLAPKVLLMQQVERVAASTTVREVQGAPTASHCCVHGLGTVWSPAEAGWCLHSGRLAPPCSLHDRAPGMCLMCLGVQQKEVPESLVLRGRLAPLSCAVM